MSAQTDLASGRATLPDYEATGLAETPVAAGLTERITTALATKWGVRIDHET